MSFGRRRHGPTPAADQPIPTSQRRTFLDVLRLELNQRHGLTAEVVRREGLLVLYVIHPGLKAGPVEIGCDMRPDGWWFTWAADDDRTIAPVEDTSGTAAVIASEFGICARNGRHAGRS